MLSFQFNIRNPFSNRWECIKTWAGVTPFANKFWEAQIDKTSDIVGLEFRLTTRQDHSGIFLCLALFGFEIIFNYYDNRHWNHQNNQWEDHNETI